MDRNPVRTSKICGQAHPVLELAFSGIQNEPVRRMRWDRVQSAGLFVDLAACTLTWLQLQTAAPNNIKPYQGRS
jgi:hypothetical protein